MTLCKLSHYSSPGDSSKGIASAILENLHRFPNVTIQDMADFCYVSVATISRFIRSIGYSSFSQFHQALCHQLDDYYYLNLADVQNSASLTETIDNYVLQSQRMAENFRTELDQETLLDMVDGMHGKKAVYIYTFFFQSSLPFLKVNLGLTGKRCEVCEISSDQYRTIPDINGDCYLLAIKNQRGDVHYMDALIRQAKQQGAQVGLILDSLNSAVLSFADDILTFTGTGTAVDSAIFNNYVTLLALAYQKRYLSL